MQVRVGVDHGDQFVPGLAETDVEPVGLAAVDRVADDPAPPVCTGRLLRGRLGVVGGAIVEDEHLERRVIGGQHRRDADRDDALFVVCGDQHGHARPAALGTLGAGRLIQDTEEQAARHP